jgi:hypothetical protein
VTEAALFELRVVAGSENRLDGLGQHFYFRGRLKKRAVSLKQIESAAHRVKV